MIECAATARVEIENVAVPPLSVPVPRVVEPSRKLTLPVGVPLPGAYRLDGGREGHRLAEDRGVCRRGNFARGGRLVDGLCQGAEVLVTKLPSPL